MQLCEQSPLKNTRHLGIEPIYRVWSYTRLPSLFGWRESPFSKVQLETSDTVAKNRGGLSLFRWRFAHSCWSEMCVCVHLRMYLYIFLPWPSIWSVQAAAQTSDPSMNPGNNFVLMLGLWSVGRLSSTILFALNMMSSLCCYDQCLQTEHCDRLGNLVIQSHLHCFRYVTHLCFNRSWDQSQTTEFRLWSAPGFYVSEYQCSIQVSHIPVDYTDQTIFCDREVSR